MSDLQPGPRLAFDGHVLTGKFQGTRTTLVGLLRAIGQHPRGAGTIVYADDPEAARAVVGCERLDYRAIGAGSSISRLLFAFPRLLRRDRADFGVFQYIAPLVGRQIVFIHDALPITHPQFFGRLSRLKTRLFYTLSARRAALVVAVSAYARDVVDQRLMAPAGRRVPVCTIHNGPSFDPSVYAAPRRPAQPRYILCVGRIEQRKNIDLLVRAFLDADLTDVGLKIVGSTDYGYRFQLPPDPRIEQIERIDDAGLIALYRGASLFAYPSAAEGFGLPLLDATLFGLPAISSMLTALPEVGGNLVSHFDPTRADAQAVLAGMIGRHFTQEPLPAPTEEQRAEQARRFNWASAAEMLLDAAARLGAQ